MAAEKELLQGIEALRGGKEEGFNVLYSYTYNFVYRRAKLFTDTEDDALDLTQETYIQAYKGIHKLENPQNIYAWLGKIVYYQGAKKYHKTENETLVYEDAEGIFEDIVSEDKEFRPEEATELEETAKIVKEMINELPELQRSAIMAFYYDNMKIDEIAEVFECSSNTIKSRLNYAKKEYVLAAETAQRVYKGTCDVVGCNATMLAESTVAGTTSVTGTASVVGTGAGTAVVKGGAFMGKKYLIGIIATLTLGSVKTFVSLEINGSLLVRITI